MKDNCKRTTNEKQTKAEKSKRNRSYSESVRAKWFCNAFNLGFLQLICRASLIFKSNLELVLSNILKQRELYELKFSLQNSLLSFESLFLICEKLLIYGNLK